MKIKATLTALAAATGLMVASSASAINFGEVWVGDQAEGEINIYKQSKLNRKFANAVPVTLHAHTDNVGTVNNKMHLIGFNNHPGLSSKSRAHVAYLGGDMQVYETNAGTFTPTLVHQEFITSGATSLHMCGGNPQNTGIACSSIGGQEIILMSADDDTNTYGVIDQYPLATMTIDAGAPAGTAAAFDVYRNTGKPICNNYDTSGNYLYVTVNSGGLFIMDVSDPSAPTVINAYDNTVISATGCGLVNDPDGKSMWTNSGSNTDADDEMVFNWKFSNIGTSNGPTVIDIPEVDNGDVHGAQFAGPSIYLWELMRLDNVIHVINKYSKTLVNTFSIATSSLGDPAGDVLDRSQFGTRMYASLRGFAPITAITAFPNLDRDPGVMTIKSKSWGYTGKVLKTTSIRSQHGNTVVVCDADDGDSHSHTGQDCDGNPTSQTVDAADPHGLKSLNYLTGF